MNRRRWLAGLIGWMGWMLFSTGAEAVLVTFKHKDPDAARVTLAGGFNDWNMDAEVMSKNDDGEWETRVDLKPGKYEYKFVVDGDWDKANKDNRSITVKAEEGPADTAAAAPSGPIDVTFRYKAPDAKDVGLGAEFNEWKWESSRMTKGEDGVWMLTVSLSPGEYAYKFVVDGDWREDPDNPLKKEVGGIQNSLIRVGQRPRPPKEPETGNEVTFRYKAPDAKDVGVGGEFNEWKWESSRMTKGADGVWTLKVSLSPGEYAYKFVVDGDWREDPDNPLKKEVDGTQNSMIRVGRPAASEAVTKAGTKFSVKAEKAKKVTLAGDFNGWNTEGIVLESKGGGIWETTIDLKPGKYEYKFLADGDWDKLGKENRKIEVK